MPRGPVPPGLITSHMLATAANVPDRQLRYCMEHYFEPEDFGHPGGQGIRREMTRDVALAVLVTVYLHHHLPYYEDVCDVLWFLGDPQPVLGGDSVLQFLGKHKRPQAMRKAVLQLHRTTPTQLNARIVLQSKQWTSPWKMIAGAQDFEPARPLLNIELDLAHLAAILPPHERTTP